MTTYIANAFSLGMTAHGAVIRTRQVDVPAIAHKLSKPVSIVGHKDTARVFSTILGIPIAHNRQSIKLTQRDNLYVGQLTGGRLPEGATSLPEKFGIEWVLVTVDGEDKPLKRAWTKGGGSIYGGLDRVPPMKSQAWWGGEVTLMQDPWGNPHWDIDGPGFHGSLHDG